MERDPRAVFEDWQNTAVTAKAAREIYGVVIDESSGTFDLERTKALRAGKRRARVDGRIKPRRLAGPQALRITENLLIRVEAGTPHYCCSKCDADLGPSSDNYKDHCIREDNPITHAVPLAGDPHRYIDADPVFRQFFCPGCGALIENEVALATEPVLRDIEVSVDGRMIQLRAEAAE